MEEWPLTHEELEELGKRLIEKNPVLDIMSKYCSSIRTSHSKDFTHCCTCPNILHKGGAERTPSFYFSEVTGHFACFGCKFSGSLFDFLAKMVGCPAHILIQEYAKRDNISLADLPERPQTFPILDLNFELSVRLRDYLIELRDSSNYAEEVRWVDAIFIRIDERFLKLTDRDYEAARMFYMQILLELERRKT